MCSQHSEKWGKTHWGPALGDPFAPKGAAATASASASGESAPPAAPKRLREHSHCRMLGPGVTNKAGAPLHPQPSQSRTPTHLPLLEELDKVLIVASPQGQVVHQQEHAQGIFLRFQASEQERRDKPEWAVDKGRQGVQGGSGHLQAGASGWVGRYRHRHVDTPQDELAVL